MQVKGELARHVEQQIEHERKQVEAMYDRLDVEVADALASRVRVLAAPVEGPQELYARDLEVARLTRTVSELRAADRALCFGRIDSVTGEAVHVGRIGLRSKEGALLLVDWRANAARPFYAATPVSPLGVRRRRHLRLHGRRVVEVSDEILDGSAPTPKDVVGDGPLVAALGRARTGRMQEAVATLQAEQDAIVRSPHRGVTVVDGGPGTGKTIVALHRAAYVLYAFPTIAQRGVLVFGPNRRFLDYISDVLPSLGENDVRLATAADLIGVEATAVEPEAVARLKGQARLATALARWVRTRQPHQTPLEFRVGQDTLTLDAPTVDAAHRHATQGGLAHNPARELFKEYVVSDLVSLLEQRTAETLTAMDDEITTLLGVDLDELVAEDLRSLGLDDIITAGGDAEVDWDALREALLDDPAIDLIIDTVWPRLRAATVLQQFLTDPDALATALPELSHDDIASFIHAHSTGYTSADLALLDETRTLIDGPPDQVYGHIVVDEAQELSEMQWRMLMRRCPAHSLTIVGDFAQSGSATTLRSWTEALGPFIGDRYAHHTLTVNYRTTAEILRAAAPLLARIAPTQQPSRSIRHGKHPHAIQVAAADLDTTLRDLVAQQTADHPSELIGVIAPATETTRLATALDGTSAVIVASSEARGLEFDTVFVIDPVGIESARKGGIRDLYVAITRATKRVTTLRVPTP